jgi:hypothetical protein
VNIVKGELERRKELGRSKLKERKEKFIKVK